MDSFLQPLRELPLRARRWCAVLVLLCGAVLGYFVFQAFASPLHREYQLDFGSRQWVSPLVQEEVWPNARRATILEHPVDVAWVDTNPLLLRLPMAGKWITAENASREATFSTSVKAGKNRPETWIQVASSGSLDLL